MGHGKYYMKLMNSKEWKQLRARILRERPLCEMCRRNKHISPANELHHIVEVEKGQTESEMRILCFSTTNIMALCHKCHRNIHNERQYHSTAAVKERQRERFEQWKDDLEKRFK